MPMASNKFQQELEDWQAVLKLPAGRRVLARLARTGAGALGASFAPGDALATAYNEGMRAMCLHMLEMARAASETDTALHDAFADILTFKEDSHDN